MACWRRGEPTFVSAEAGCQSGGSRSISRPIAIGEALISATPAQQCRASVSRFGHSAIRVVCDLMRGGASAGEEVGEAGGEERGVVERVVAVHERRVDLHLRRACCVIAFRTAAVNRCVDWLLDCVIAHVRSLEDLLLQRERVPRHPNQPYLPLALEPVERGKSLLDDHVDRRRELGVMHLLGYAGSVARTHVAASGVMPYGERYLHRVDVVEF